MQRCRIRRLGRNVAAWSISSVFYRSFLGRWDGPHPGKSWQRDLFYDQQSWKESAKVETTIFLVQFLGLEVEFTSSRNVKVGYTDEWLQRAWGLEFLTKGGHRFDTTRCLWAISARQEEVDNMPKPWIFLVFSMMVFAFLYLQRYTAVRWKQRKLNCWKIGVKYLRCFPRGIKWGLRSDVWIQPVTLTTVQQHGIFDVAPPIGQLPRISGLHDKATAIKNHMPDLDQAEIVVARLKDFWSDAAIFWGYSSSWKAKQKETRLHFQFSRNE